jgi:hypothetical protein
MAKKKFFTYDLRRNGKIMRRGKGSVSRRNLDLITSYLGARYPAEPWDEYSARWHGSEGAALKAEAAMIDGYERRTGHLPPWNVRRGGGGNNGFVACRGSLADGRPCRNRAIAGNGGYCGVHGR